MLPDNHYEIENAARRRLHGGRRKRAGRFTPPEWPVSRGPTPDPRRAN